jgi:hypothetical protein
MVGCCARATRQSLAYLRLGGPKVALPIGRHALIERDGLRRIVL